MEMKQRSFGKKVNQRFASLTRFVLPAVIVAGCLAALPQINAGCVQNCTGSTTVYGESADALLAGADSTAIGNMALSSNTGNGVDNTAVGSLALLSNTTGYINTAVGFEALSSLKTGQENTALGAGALFSVTSAGDNTAVGTNALFYSITGGNTAVGAYAMVNNQTGIFNTAIGINALQGDIFGSDNTASGQSALYTNSFGSSNCAYGMLSLYSNVSGNNNTAQGYSSLKNNTVGNNTALGYQALFSNSTGTPNTAVGYQALYTNGTGSNNTASGASALYTNGVGAQNTADGANALFANTSGSNNTAGGYGALAVNNVGTNNTAYGANAMAFNTVGTNNIAIGSGAGVAIVTDNNIDIGNSGTVGDSAVIRLGNQGTQTSAYVAGIYQQPVGAGAMAVRVNSAGKLGTVVSSARFKEAIKPMDQKSDPILALNPVVFRYKKEIDSSGEPQFGLVAEEVEKVDRDLVEYDPQGKPFSVRYEAVNAMLLNEFLKEHRKVESQGTRIAAQGERAEQQDATIKELKKEIAQLRAGLKSQAEEIQKVGAQVTARRPSTRIASAGY